MGDPEEGVDAQMDQWLDRVHQRVGGDSSTSSSGSDAEMCTTDDAVQNAITDRDWTTLRTDFVQAVQIWCNGMQHVVNQFEQNVRQADTDSDDVSLAVTIIDGVVSEFVPTQLKVARAVAQPIFQRVVRDLSSGRVSLRRFCEVWDSGFNSYKEDRGAHDVMFAEFREHLDTECGDSLTLEAASRQISYLSERLPNSQAVRRALLRAWIDSTEDESVIVGDVWDDVGGYFHVRVRRLDRNRWELTRAYLDDTDEQAGVIAMLQREYPNQRLERLPFPMRIYITHGINGDTTYGEKGRSGGFSLRSGTQQVLDDWIAASQGHPTTGDLSRDSIF